MNVPKVRLMFTKTTCFGRSSVIRGSTHDTHANQDPRSHLSAPPTGVLSPSPLPALPWASPSGPTPQGLPPPQGLACSPRLLVAAYMEKTSGAFWLSASWCICDLLCRRAESCSLALASLFAAATWLGVGLGARLGFGLGRCSGGAGQNRCGVRRHTRSSRICLAVSYTYYNPTHYD